MRIVPLVALLVSCSMQSHAMESVNRAEQSRLKHFRSHYAQSEALPDGIALFDRIELIRSVGERNYDFSLHLLRDGTGLPQQQAAELHGYLLTLGKRIAEHALGVESQILCSEYALVDTDERANHLFEAVADSQEAIYELHLAVARSELSGALYGGLRRWIARSKKEITYAKFDQSEARRGQPQGASIEQLLDICNAHAQREAE